MGTLGSSSAISLDIQTRLYAVSERGALHPSHRFCYECREAMSPLARAMAPVARAGRPEATRAAFWGLGYLPYLSGRKRRLAAAGERPETNGRFPQNRIREFSDVQRLSEISDALTHP